MTEELFGLGDPVIRRLQQAFSHKEPTTELAAIIQRAARYQAGQGLDASDQPAPHRGLTEADLAAARQRQPAAVSRVYSAYAPPLFRFFMAAVGNRQEAQDLTGSVFVSAFQALPGFRGPVDALGGWLFRIARHDLYDFRRKQDRSPGLDLLDDHLDEATATAGATEQPGQQSGTRTRSTDAPLDRLSPQEREVLALLANGWSNRRIAEECFLSLNTVRTHVQNVLVKLGVHSKLEAVAFAMQHGWLADAKNPQELALKPLDESRGDGRPPAPSP